MKRILFSLAALLFWLAAQAKIELSPLFTDNMVFQQNCSAPVWGKATYKLYLRVAFVAGRVTIYVLDNTQEAYNVSQYLAG